MKKSIRYLNILKSLFFLAALILILILLIGSPQNRLTLLYALAACVLFFLIIRLILYSRIKSQYKLKYLSPFQALTFRQLAEVFVDGGKLEILNADQLVSNTDHYLNIFESPKKFQIKIALFALEYIPLIHFYSPVTWQKEATLKQFIGKYFSSSSGMIRDLVRGAYQLVYLAYYGDKKTWTESGFIPFEERDSYKKMPAQQDPAELQIMTASKNNALIDSDICVIGSGAGGAVAACRIAQKTGRRVTILEAGEYMVPQKDFSNLEPEMIGRLYIDGGLQMTQNFDMSILQGQCLGGTTVVNNGICFDMPQAVADEWNSLGAQLDFGLLKTKYREAREMIGVRPLTEDIVNKGALRLAEIFRKTYNAKTIWFDTNFDGCGGSGYCNIGCKYNRKMSMLLNYLPQALENGAQIYAGMKVLKIATRGGQATHLVCRTTTGDIVNVKARHFIISCGAIASSVLLLKSGIKKNTGTRLSFNVASPMNAEYPDKLNSFDGVQMCCYLDHQGLLIENTFNPPATTALIMPGWFEEHFKRMTRYPFLATASPVTATKAEGEIKRTLMDKLMQTWSVKYDMDMHDFNILKEGMKLLSHAFFESGAVSVFPSTFHGQAIDSEKNIDEVIDDIKKPEDVSLSSAHPQGGNPMSNDPALGAVDAQFRLYGYDNIYVCDASVFPSSVRVNPQLTVMALGEYFAEKFSSYI